MPIVTGAGWQFSPRTNLLSRFNSPQFTFGPYSSSLGSFTQPESSSSTAPWWGGLIQGGFGILSQILAQRAAREAARGMGFNAGGTFSDMSPTVGTGPMTADPASLATISPAIIAAGGRIVGNIIRITRRNWAKVPDLVKQAAAALGMTVLFEALSGDEDGERRRPRRTGISAAQLRGFNKVCGLLRRVGMQPKGLRRGPRKRACR